MFKGIRMKKIFEKAILIVWIPVIVLLISSILTAICGTYTFALLVLQVFTEELYHNSRIVTT
jgi:hypothetical protein